MGVNIVGLAVGGPAGVADAQVAGQICPVMGQILQHLQAALGLFHLQPCGAEHRHTGGVIAPVFQALQAVQQNGSRLLLANISYDSTHIGSS